MFTILQRVKEKGRRLIARYKSAVPFFVIVLFFEVIPIVNMILRSLLDSQMRFTLNNYILIFTKAVYLVAIRNSLFLSLVSSLFGLIISLVTALSIPFLSDRHQKVFLAMLNMLSNFAGLPLAFAFIIILGSSGTLILAAKEIGFSFLADFRLYTIQGLAIVYIYFQIPLGVLLLLPALDSVKKEWKEAAYLLKANSFQFWARVGVPVLMPSLIGTFSTLFANALAAYATAYLLVVTNVPLLPIQIASMYVGDMRQRPELGSALSITLLLMMLIVVAVSNLLTRRYEKYRIRKDNCA